MTLPGEGGEDMPTHHIIYNLSDEPNSLSLGPGHPAGSSLLFMPYAQNGATVSS